MGGVPHGLDNHLTANELPQKPNDTSALYGIPTSWRLAFPNSIGAIRTPILLIFPVEYAIWAVLGAMGIIDPYPVRRIGLTR